MCSRRLRLWCRFAGWLCLASPIATARAQVAPDTPVDLHKLPPAALAAYQQQFVTVEDVLHVSDGSSTRSVEYTKGKYREALTEEQFLQTVGSAELAEQRRRRRAGAYALVGASVVSLIAGALFTLASVPAPEPSCGHPEDPGFSQCVRDRVAAGPGNPGPPMTCLWAGLGAGAVLLGAGVAVHPGAINPVEMRRLADEHNQALLRRLSGAQVSLSGRF